MLKIIKLAGESLTPEYQPGDYVLVATLPWLLRRLRPGDLLLFRHHAHGLLIKRLDHRRPDGGLFVTGSQPDSLDSRQFGPISPQAVTGKVLWHIRKPHPN
jgi:phage repressor protein C with HTH and peptisase S24 domain